MAKRAAGRVRWGSVWLLCVLMLVLVLERFQLIAGRMKERSSNKEDRLQVCERSSLTLSSWVTGRSFYKEDKTAGIWTRRHQAKLKGVMSHSKQGFKQSMHPGSSQAQNFPPTQLLQCWQPGLNPSDKSSEKSCLCNLTSPDQPRRKNCMY